MMLKKINSENRIWRAFYIFAITASMLLLGFGIGCIMCSCKATEAEASILTEYDKAIFVCDFRPTESLNSTDAHTIDVADYTHISNGMIKIVAKDGRAFYTHGSNVILYTSEGD